MITPTTASEWRLTGRCWNRNYSIESPMISTELTFEGSDKVTITINGTYSYKDSSTGRWSIGKVTFTPSTLTFESGDYGHKAFTAFCSSIN